MRKFAVKLYGIERESFFLAEFKSSLLHAAEKFGLGIAEKVDGLHRVADDKDGAAGTIGPCRDQRGDEFVLAAAGVLELVDQQVADAIGNDERGFGGQLVFAAEDVPGDLRDFNEVNGASFSEHGLQFASGMAEKSEAGAHDLPVFFGIAGGRKFSDAGKRLFKTRHGRELLAQFLHAQLFFDMLFGKAKTFGDLLAEATFAGQQKICQAEICVPGIFKSDAVFMRAVGEIGEFGEFPMDMRLQP